MTQTDEALRIARESLAIDRDLLLADSRRRVSDLYISNPFVSDYSSLGKEPEFHMMINNDCESEVHRLVPFVVHQGVVWREWTSEVRKGVTHVSIRFPFGADSVANPEQVSGATFSDSSGLHWVRWAHGKLEVWDGSDEKLVGAARRTD